MKEIDEYLKVLYKRINATDKEIADLKAEMKNHLMESVRELQAEGNSAQDSVRIAIERFGDPGHLSKDLKAKYNIAAIDQIGEMNKTFKYHNGVLLAVAVIAADTGYECPYFKDIAELGVMKLSDSLAVINLALKAREAKTQEEKEFVENQIKQMKAGAELKTCQQALDYNSKNMKP